MKLPNKYCIRYFINNLTLFKGDDELNVEMDFKIQENVNKNPIRLIIGVIVKYVKSINRIGRYIISFLLQYRSSFGFISFKF